MLLGMRLLEAVPLRVQVKWTGAFGALWSVGIVCACGRCLSKWHGRLPGRQAKDTSRCSLYERRLLAV